MDDIRFARPISRRTIMRGALAGAGAVALSPLAGAYAAAVGRPTSRSVGRLGDQEAPEEYVAVGFILGIDYWKGPRAGLDRAAELFGVKTSLVGSDQADQAAQNDIIHQVIQTKPAGLIVLPLDPAGVDTAVQAAMEAGIPTMTCLNGHNETGHQIGYVGFDRAEAGAMGADIIASLVSGPGTVAALVFDASVPAMQAGLKGFQDRLAALNPELEVVVGVDTAVKAAMDAGIPTMTCLNGYNETGSQIGYLGFDRAKAGALGAQIIAGKVTGPGTVAALVFDPSVPAMQAGLKGFTDELAKLAPDLKVVTGVDNADPEFGTTVAGQLIQANPDLKAFMSIDTSGGPSAARALAEAGRTDVVVVAGGMGDHSTEVWPLIENGQVAAAIVEPSSLDFFQQVQYLYNLNRQVSNIDWRAHPEIRVVPAYTDMGSFIVDTSNVDVMKALPAA
jgi:ABC-type sugar transport system substrate-binding protein